MRLFLRGLALSIAATLSLIAADPSPAPSSAAPAVTVHIKEFAYVPKTVTIKPGDAVRFINDDDIAHTVTARDTSFDSGDFDKGKAWVHTFAAAGTYTYFCADHPSMQGSVIVRGATPAPASSSNK